MSPGVLYTIKRGPCLNSPTRSRAYDPQAMFSGERDYGADRPLGGESRESILAKRRARRLAERLAKPAYVNSDACCRGGHAGLAYESARLGNRTALVSCSDITLAEHLALLMALRDAADSLSGRVVFRVDSAAVVDPLRRDYPALAEAKREIAEMLRQHTAWSLLLVERERNWVAHNLANKPLRTR